MTVIRVIAVAACAFVALATGVVIGAIHADDPQMRRNQWEDPDLGGSLAEGVATERHIWLLGRNGGLVRFDRETGDRLVLGTRVQDILADGPHLWAVSFQPYGSAFELWDLRNPSLPRRTEDDFASDPDSSLHLLRTPQGVAVLTPDAVFLSSGEGLSRQHLANAWIGRVSVAADGSGSIYAGRNSGEFGGALTRIDVRSGDIRQISGVSAAEEVTGACEGDFNPSCDPIVGILPDPRHPDCVIAASGQFHLGMTHGKVYRVCGDDLTLTYQTPNRVPLIERLFAPSDYWRGLSAPIESLTQTSDGWVAVSEGRYFRLRNGQIGEHRMPDFHAWSGLHISQEQDGLLFVIAACCSGLAFAPDHWIIAVPIVR